MKPAPAMRPRRATEAQLAALRQGRQQHAVLTPEQVRQIRDSDAPSKVFAIDLRVSEATISRVRNGSRWGWVK